MKTPRGFRSATILVNCALWYDPAGEISIKALVRGQLAVHEALGHYPPWSVTHIPTGRVVIHADSQKQALSTVRKLEKMCDWRRVKYGGPGELPKGVAKAKIERVKAFKDALEAA